MFPNVINDGVLCFCFCCCLYVRFAKITLKRGFEPILGIVKNLICGCEKVGLIVVHRSVNNWSSFWLKIADADV